MEQVQKERKKSFSLERLRVKNKETTRKNLVFFTNYNVTYAVVVYILMIQGYFWRLRCGATQNIKILDRLKSQKIYNIFWCFIYLDTVK